MGGACVYLIVFLILDESAVAAGQPDGCASPVVETYIVAGGNTGAQIYVGYLRVNRTGGCRE